MQTEKIFLLLIASLLLVFGAAYFLYPELIAAMAGLQLVSIPAKIDYWAIYAGVQIGFGAFLLRCALGNFALDAALLSVAYVVGGIALLRVIGIAYYASFDTFSLGGLVFEGPTAITAWYLFYRSRRRSKAV